MYICADNTINKSTHLRRKHTGHICTDNRLDTAAHMLKNTLNTSVQLRRQHTEHICTYAQGTHLTHLNICTSAYIVSRPLYALYHYLVSRKKFNEGKTAATVWDSVLLAKLLGAHVSERCWAPISSFLELTALTFDDVCK
jgi:hypothetical protein